MLNTLKGKWDEALTLDAAPTLDEIYNFVAQTASAFLNAEQQNSSRNHLKENKRHLP